MHHAEVQFRTHLDEVHELDLLILRHNRRAQRNVRVTARSDLGLEDLLPLKTLAERLNGNVTIAVEVGLPFRRTLLLRLSLLSAKLLAEILVRHKLEDKLHTAVQIESQTDRTRRMLADHAHHVAVVFQITALDHFGQIHAGIIGGFQQRLRLEEIRIGFAQRLRLFHEFLGIRLNFLRLFRIRRLDQQPEERFIIIPLEQRVNRGGEHPHDHQHDERPQNQRSLVHSRSSCFRRYFFSAGAAVSVTGSATPFLITSTTTLSAISTI